MTSGIPYFARAWRCPRCKCPRGYATVETSLSSSIQYEVLICEHCACVDHRAADIQSVATLAARGERGVRHVVFPHEVEPLRWNSGSGALPITPKLASGSLPSATAVGPSNAMRALDKPIHIPTPPPVPPAASRWSASPRPAGPRILAGCASVGMGCVFGAPLVGLVVGIVAAVHPLFSESNAPVPAPTLADPAVPVVLLAELPGAPHAIDPGTIIDQARRASGLGSNAVLTQIEGVFVGSKGTVDLDNPHYKGRMVYRFEGKTDAPTAPARPEGIPLGAPAMNEPPSTMYHYRAVLVDMNGTRIVETRDWPINQNQRLAQEVLPHCSFAQVWEAARSGDAPADAVATVTYTIDNNKPHWWFAIKDTPFGFTINPANCTRY